MGMESDTNTSGLKAVEMYVKGMSKKYFAEKQDITPYCNTKNEAVRNFFAYTMNMWVVGETEYGDFYFTKIIPTNKKNIFRQIVASSEDGFGDGIYDVAIPGKRFTFNLDDRILTVETKQNFYPTNMQKEFKYDLEFLTRMDCPNETELEARCEALGLVTSEEVELFFLASPKKKKELYNSLPHIKFLA